MDKRLILFNPKIQTLICRNSISIAASVPVVFFSPRFGPGQGRQGDAQFTFILVNFPLLLVHLQVTTRRRWSVDSPGELGCRPTRTQPSLVREKVLQRHLQTGTCQQTARGLRWKGLASNNIGPPRQRQSAHILQLGICHNAGADVGERSRPRRRRPGKIIGDGTLRPRETASVWRRGERRTSSVNFWK